MNTSRKYILIASTLAAVLAAALAWSWEYFEDQRSAAFAAAEETESCRRLADQIAAQRRSAVANTPELVRQLELTRRIAHAAVDAHLPARVLDRIENDPPRHAADGAYLEKPTRIVLRGVTLRQLVTLLHAVGRPAEGVRVERIHLSAPSESPESQAWSAEATLLQILPDQPDRPTGPQR